MRNCGVTKNVVFGYSCRYTVYHTQNNNHLDQNIGTIWHKRRMLVNDNTAEYVSQEKKKLSRNYPRWRYRHDKPAYRLLKQAKHRVSDWSLWGKTIACWFPHRYHILKKSVSLIQAKKWAQLCLQTELADKNKNHFTHRSYRGEHNKSTSRKKKIVTGSLFLTL